MDISNTLIVIYAITQTMLMVVFIICAIALMKHLKGDSRMANQITHLPASAKTGIAFWIWRNLADGRVPFYDNYILLRHKTYVAPVNKSRLRLWLWNQAVSYLMKDGQLTTTPTLREKF